MSDPVGEAERVFECGCYWKGPVAAAPTYCLEHGVALASPGTPERVILARTAGQAAGARRASEEQGALEKEVEALLAERTPPQHD